MRPINLLVVHCSATPPDMDIGVNEIRDWHKQRGWKDVGYHYIIRRDGTIETGRPENMSGAHAVGYNFASIGICLVGGYGFADFTYSQYSALKGLVSELLQSYPDAECLGHRDIPGVKKDCPCFDVKAFFYDQTGGQ